MKTDKYKDPIKREVVDDNIKMEVPDEIATDMAKNNLKKKVNTIEVCHVCAKECQGVFSITYKYMKELSINVTSVVTSLHQKSFSKIPSIEYIQE